MKREKDKDKREADTNMPNRKSTHQYLTLQLDKERYAIEVSRIEEVLEYQSITRVPKMPESMRGVINVRGTIVPIVDLRYKFGLPVSEATVDTSIVVLEVAQEGETIRIGTIADAVEEVVEIAPKQIEPAPKIGTKLDNDFIEGLGKIHENFVVILDTDKIFTTEEIAQIAEPAAE